MKKIVFLFGLLMAASQWSFAQMDKSIKLNEVMTRNATNLQDEYGNRGPWVEIANISHSTYNIRGMYITTDRAVLDETMSVPERVKRMTFSSPLSLQAFASRMAAAMAWQDSGAGIMPSTFEKRRPASNVSDWYISTASMSLSFSSCEIIMPAP